MYFMYTRYLDLVAVHPAEKSPKIDFQMMMKQQERDHIVKKSILDNDLGYFPKSKKEFEEIKQKLENMSKILHEQLVFFFSVRDEQKSPEKECLVLRKGIWNTYADTADAINSVFHVSKDEPTIDTHIIHYPNN